MFYKVKSRMYGIHNSISLNLNSDWLGFTSCDFPFGTSNASDKTEKRTNSLLLRYVPVNACEAAHVPG